ncbi:MAG: hypothetical protein C4530_12655 [Desulfobacteraceae bacterium]|nr:MAG: hypothetical protein C4530_12655 [Desulfobacteraceae bacterium]
MKEGDSNREITAEILNQGVPGPADNLAVFDQYIIHGPSLLAFGLTTRSSQTQSGADGNFLSIDGE